MITPDMETVRPFVEAEIERLIEILDTLEPDPDFEEGDDDEPWLGAPDARPGSWNGLYLEGNDDREQDDSNLEDNADLEADDCDLEPDHDNEHEHDGRANYLGHCSPIDTMIGQRI